MSLLGHLAIQEKARRLHAQRRAFVLAERGAGGMAPVALAAARLAMEEGRSIVVLTGANLRAGWRELFAAMGYPGTPALLSIQQHSANPELLDPKAVLVLDGYAMTLNTRSVSWGYFAPVVRAADVALMVVPMETWPASLVLSELVSHYDHAVPLWRREVAGVVPPH